MSDTRKEYVPPTAEVILLAPDEKLAAWDWSFDHFAWKESAYYQAQGNAASAIVVNGTNVWAEDGYTIKK